MRARPSLPEIEAAIAAAERRPPLIRTDADRAELRRLNNLANMRLLRRVAA